MQRNRAANFQRKRGKPITEPYELVEKEIHGQRVMVKVFRLAYGRAAAYEADRLGLKRVVYEGYDSPPQRHRVQRTRGKARKA